MAITFTPSTSETPVTFTYGHFSESATVLAMKELNWTGVDGIQVMDFGLRGKLLEIDFLLESDTAQTSFENLIRLTGTLATESRNFHNSLCLGFSWSDRKKDKATNKITVKGHASFQCLTPDLIA